MINKEEDLRTKPTKAKVMRGNEMKTVRAPSERSELQQHCKWVHGRYKARDGWEGGLLVNNKVDKERVRVISFTTFLTIRKLSLEELSQNNKSEN